MSLRKKLNSRLINWAYRRKAIRVPGYPYCLDIETTSLCQLDCIRCPRRDMTRPDGSMSVEDFRKVMGLLGPYCYRLWLHLFGDPLLTPGLPEMIRCAKEAGVDKVGLSTNALGLSEEVGRRLCRAGLDCIILSLDAATRETYDVVRRGGHFEAVVRNSERFLALPEARMVREKVVQIIDMEENRHEIPAFIERWRGPGREVRVKEMDTWAGYFGNGKPDGLVREPCVKLWTSLSIDWRGEVSICCRDFDMRVRLGNVLEDDFAAIWNGPTIQRYRRRMREGSYADLPLCAPCPEWKWGNLENYKAY